MPVLKPKKTAVKEETVKDAAVEEQAEHVEQVEQEVVEETPNLPAETTGTDMADTAEVDAGEYDDWLDEDDDEGGAVPFLKIEQKKPPEMIGKLVCPDMDEAYDIMRVVLLKAQEGCVLWPEKFSADSEPLCKSDDGINPVVPENGEPYCDLPDCCKGKWRKVDGKNEKTKPCAYGNWDNGEKARCTELMKLLVLDIETNIPYWITVKGYGLTEYSKLNSQLGLKVKALKGQLARQGRKGAKKCLFSFKLGTKLKEHESGDHYIPEFSDIELAPPEMQPDILAFAFQAREMNLASGGDTEE